MQLDDLGEILGPGELLGKIEARIQIALSDVDEFAVEGGSALSGGIERPLKRIDGIFERVLGFLIEPLGSASPSSLPKLERSQEQSYRERSLLKVGGGFLECFARLLGGGLWCVGFIHGWFPRVSSLDLTRGRRSELTREQVMLHCNINGAAQKIKH